MTTRGQTVSFAAGMDLDALPDIDGVTWRMFREGDYVEMTRLLNEDLEVMGPVRLAEVEEAQQAIVAAAKELEAEGSIVLGGKGKDDILV